MGPKVDGLTFFHALSGNDPTASFVGHGKSRCFKAWNNNPQFESTFRELSTPGIELTGKLIGEVEAYVIKLYCPKAVSTTVNKARQEMSTQHAISLDKLPPTSNALNLKVRRCYYVAGLVWGQSLIMTQGLPDVRNWGWVVDADEQLRIKWMTSNSNSASIVKCSCKKNCSGRCSCFVAKVKCTTSGVS